MNYVGKNWNRAELIKIGLQSVRFCVLLRKYELDSFGLFLTEFLSVFYRIYLASIFGYHAYIDPQIMTLFPSKQDDKNFVTHFNKEVAKDAGIYFR